MPTHHVCIWILKVRNSEHHIVKKIIKTIFYFCSFESMSADIIKVSEDFIDHPQNSSAILTTRVWSGRMPETVPDSTTGYGSTQIRLPRKTQSLTPDNATSERTDHYLCAVFRIRIRDPLLFFTPGSGMQKNPHPGPGIRNMIGDVPRSYFQAFSYWIKNA
jgi:hypothetical protein